MIIYFDWSVRVTEVAHDNMPQRFIQIYIRNMTSFIKLLIIFLGKFKTHSLQWKTSWPTDPERNCCSLISSMLVPRSIPVKPCNGQEKETSSEWRHGGDTQMEISEIAIAWANMHQIMDSLNQWKKQSKNGTTLRWHKWNKRRHTWKVKVTQNEKLRWHKIDS